MSATHRRAILVNAAANWSGFVAQLAIVFYLSPLLVHGLGDRRYGMWALIESVLAYLTLLDLGVAASVVRYVARSDDRGAVNRVVGTSVTLFAAAGAAVLTLAAAAAYLLLPRLGVPDDLFAETQGMLLILGLNLGLGLPMQTYGAVLDGLGRYPARSAVRTAAALLRVPLTLVVLHAGGGLLALGLVILGTNVAEQLTVAAAAKLYLPGLRLRPAFDRQTFREIRGYSVDAFLALLAGRISFQTSALVIGAFLAPQFITFFAVAARLVETSKSLLRSATTVLTPAFSALDARGDAGAVRRMFFDSTRWVLWLVVPLQAGLVLLGEPFLTLWMGTYHAEACYPVLVILSVPLALTISQSVSARVLYGVGELRWFSRAVLIEAGANLALSVALIGPFGIEGVAWGTTVPQLVFNALLVRHVCRLLGVPVAEYLRRSFAAPLAAVTLPAAAWLLGPHVAQPTSWTMFLAVAGGGAAAYLLAALPLEFGAGAVAGRLRGIIRLPRPRSREPIRPPAPVEG